MFYMDNTRMPTKETRAMRNAKKLGSRPYSLCKQFMPRQVNVFVGSAQK